MHGVDQITHTVAKQSLSKATFRNRSDPEDEVNLELKPQHRHEGKRANRRKGGALRPNAAVLAEDCRGGEAVAVNIAHQVVIDVLLPRHRFVASDFFFFLLALADLLLWR